MPESQTADPMEELQAQAQELDMGYGKPKTAKGTTKERLLEFLKHTDNLWRSEQGEDHLYRSEIKFLRSMVENIP